MTTTEARHVRKGSVEIDPYSAPHIYYGSKGEQGGVLKSRAYSSVGSLVASCPAEY